MVALVELSIGGGGGATSTSTPRRASSSANVESHAAPPPVPTAAARIHRPTAAAPARTAMDLGAVDARQRGAATWPPSAATSDVKTVGMINFPCTAAKFEGGAFRLGWARGMTKREIVDASSRSSGAASAVSPYSRAAMWRRNWESVGGQRLPTMRRGPKRVSTHSRQRPSDHPGRPDKCTAAERETSSGTLERVQIAVATKGAAEEASSYLQISLTRTCQAEGDAELEAKKRIQLNGAPPLQKKRRMRGVQFVGRESCLGREVLEASAATRIAAVRQKKTKKSTSTTCTRGELITLLTEAAAPQGLPMRQRWRLRPVWSLGTPMQPVGRQLRAVN
jgi:hypothetical protein